MKSALTAVLGALAMALCAADAQAAKALPPPTPASLSPCALAATEISKIFGMTVDKAELADMQFPGGRDVGCIYTFPGTQTVLSIRQTWGTPPVASAAQKAAPAEAPRPGQEVQAIAGDPDRAIWKVSNSQDGQSVTLTYTRAGGLVQTTVVIHGGELNVGAMQQKLLLLHRTP